MKRLWDVCNHKIGWFLCAQMLLGAFYGICVWSVLSLFILKDVIWMLCFGGYGAFILGFLNGVFFLWKCDEKVEG